MQEKDPSKKIHDLNDAGFRALLDRLFNDSDQTTKPEDLEKNKEANICEPDQPTVSQEIDEFETDNALGLLQEVIDDERDQFGNYVIPENTEPLAPPIAPKSTPAGRDLLETLTTNPKYNKPKKI